jgi:hypothetical protein
VAETNLLLIFKKFRAHEDPSEGFPKYTLAVVKHPVRQIVKQLKMPPTSVFCLRKPRFLPRIKLRVAPLPPPPPSNFSVAGGEIAQKQVKNAVIAAASNVRC